MHMNYIYRCSYEMTEGKSSFHTGYVLLHGWSLSIWTYNMQQLNKPMNSSNSYMAPALYCNTKGLNRQFINGWYSRGSWNLVNHMIEVKLR